MCWSLIMPALKQAGLSCVNGDANGGINHGKGDYDF